MQSKPYFRSIRFLFKGFLKVFLAGVVCFLLIEGSTDDGYRSWDYHTEALGVEQSQAFLEQINENTKTHYYDPLFYASIVPYKHKRIYESGLHPAIMHYMLTLSGTNSGRLHNFQQIAHTWEEFSSQLYNNNIKDNEDKAYCIALIKSGDIEKSNELIRERNDRAGMTHKWSLLQHEKPRLYDFLPHIIWNGQKNRFHYWLKSYITGDWGVSLTDGRPIISKIWTAFLWTSSLGLVSFILAMLAALCTGLLFHYSDSRTRINFSMLAGFVFASPVFILATLLIQWTTKGGFFSIFSSVVRPLQNLSILEFFHHYTLPVFCLSIGIWAFLHLQLSAKVTAVKHSIYVHAAKQRGVSRKTLLWKYIFPNSAFPLITAIPIIIPSLLSGTLAVEIIFDIPGLGQLLYHAIQSQDWNMTLAIVYLNMLIVIFFNELTQMMYQKLNPQNQIQMVMS